MSHTSNIVTVEEVDITSGEATVIHSSDPIFVQKDEPEIVEATLAESAELDSAIEEIWSDESTDMEICCAESNEGCITPQYADLVQTAYANNIVGRAIFVHEDGKCYLARIVAYCDTHELHRVVYGREWLFMYDDLPLMTELGMWHFAAEPMAAIRNLAPLSPAALIGRIVIIFQDLQDGTGFKGVVLEHLPLTSANCLHHSNSVATSSDFRFRVMDVETTTFHAIDLHAHPYYPIA